MLKNNTLFKQLLILSKNKTTYFKVMACISLFFSNNLLAHGFVVNSRADGCTPLAGLNSDCGMVSDLPQYVLGVGRFPNSGPVDGKLASAEITGFSELDVQNDSRWYKHDITTGAIEFLWGINISHPTTEFRYFITKPNWNSNITLRRSSFNLTPFCTVPVNLDEIPNFARHDCTIPSGYTGYHVIYATWDTTNEDLGFYQVLDVNINEQIDTIFQNGFE